MMRRRWTLAALGLALMTAIVWEAQADAHGDASMSVFSKRVAEAIRGSGLGTQELPWSKLDQLKLRYYGTRRQKKREAGGGFMQLTLKGGGTSLTLESSIEGFEYIAWRAALMQLEIVASETMRPLQTCSISSSREISRWGLRARKRTRSKTSGSTGHTWSPRRST